MSAWISGREESRRSPRYIRAILLILAALALALLPLGTPPDGTRIAHAQTTVGVKFFGQPKPNADGEVTIHFSALGQTGVPFTNVPQLPKDAVKVSEDNSPVSDFSLQEDDTPSAIVLMLDTSRDMTVPAPNSSTIPLEAAKSAATDFIQRNTKQNDEISIGTFSSQIFDYPPFVNDQLKSISEVGDVKATATGGTCIYDALFRAVAHVNKTSAPSKAVVLITNGRDAKPGAGRCSTRTQQQVIDTANESAVPLYILGITRNVDITELDDIASHTDGKFALADNPSLLTGVFNEVSQRLSGHYLIRYKSNAASGNHLVQIDVNQGDAGVLSGQSQFYMPPVTPKIKAVKFDPPMKDNVLDGKVRISALVDLPSRVGRIEYVVKGSTTVTYTTSGASYDWDWDSAQLLNGSNPVTATLEVRAYNVVGTDFSTIQPIPFSVAPAPAPLPTTQFVLLGIGIAVIVTLLLTLFMFLNRGKVGAAIARKPASVTKGEPLAELVVVEGPGVTKQQEHFLYGDRSVGIGRDEDQAIALPGERVSRSHGEIIYRRNQFFYNETKATNGTAIDGQTAPKGTLVPLRDGAEILFGGQTRTVFKLRPAGMAAAAGTYQPMAPGTPPAAAPRVSQAELRTTEWVRETPLRNTGNSQVPSVDGYGYAPPPPPPTAWQPPTAVEQNGNGTGSGGGQSN